MRKVSTILFMVNDFNAGENLILDINALFSESTPADDFTEVYEILNKGLIAPSEKIVSEILEFSRTYKK